MEHLMSPDIHCCFLKCFIKRRRSFAPQVFVKCLLYTGKDQCTVDTVQSQFTCHSVPQWKYAVAKGFLPITWSNLSTLWVNEISTIFTDTSLGTGEETKAPRSFLTVTPLVGGKAFNLAQPLSCKIIDLHLYLSHRHKSYKTLSVRCHVLNV